MTDSSAWMKSANVRLALYVAMNALPIIIADLSGGHVSIVTACVVLLNMLTTAKTFMADPSVVDGPPPRVMIKTEDLMAALQPFFAAERAGVLKGPIAVHPEATPSLTPGAGP